MADLIRHLSSLDGDDPESMDPIGFYEPYRKTFPET